MSFLSRPPRPPPGQPRAGGSRRSACWPACRPWASTAWLGRLRAGGRADVLIPLGAPGLALHRPDHAGDPGPAGDPLPLLPADHRRLSRPAAAPTPWPRRTSGPRRPLAAAALMLDYILNVAVGISAGRGRAGLGRSRPAPVHPAALPGDPGADHPGEPARAREAGLAFALPTYLFIALPRGRARRSGLGGGRSARPPAAGRPAAAPAGDRGGRPLAAAARLRQRLHRHDRRRGGEQRRDRLPRAGGRQRPPDPDGHRRRSWACCWRHRLPLPAYGIGAMDRGRAGLPERPLPAGRGRGRPGRRSTTSPSGSVLAVLCLSANTSFAGFPRLCRLVAEDGFLPRAFAAGPAAGLLGRHRLPGRRSRAAAGRLRRHHRPADPAVRRRGVPGLHALAGRAWSSTGAGSCERRGRGPGRRASLAVNAVGAAATAAPGGDPGRQVHARARGSPCC